MTTTVPCQLHSDTYPLTTTRCNRHWCEDCYAEPVSRIHLRALQQADITEDLQRNGWTSVEGGTVVGPGAPVKVYSKLCVEHCLIGEMMAGAGSNGMWG